MNRMTPEEIFTELMMTHQVNPGLVLLVEGDEECKLIDAHIATESVRTFPAGAKSATIGAINRLVQAGVQWCLAVIDRDFGPRLAQPHIVSSRNYDLIMDVVSARREGVTRLAISSTPPGQVRRFEKENNTRVHDAIIECCIPMAAARLACVDGAIKGSSRGLSAAGIVDAWEKSSHLDHVAATMSTRSGESVANILKILTNYCGNLPKPNRAVNGHDYASTLLDLVNSRTGSASRREIENLLRSLATRGCWRKIGVAVFIDQWARQRGISIWGWP